ncbi:hypothetical protein NPIL_16421 [Nephila pilipes]|uniref:Uncharacterized protein n=1 Tax=Nephila pilipes TaxID=299642 RepID=A0A8X6N478_NEPPI|nr:hypothetical protein NPIL_16421 [Nephila pilipes]
MTDINYFSENTTRLLPYSDRGQYTLPSSTLSNSINPAHAIVKTGIDEEHLNLITLVVEKGSPETWCNHNEKQVWDFSWILYLLHLDGVLTTCQ